MTALLLLLNYCLENNGVCTKIDYYFANYISAANNNH